MAICPAHEDRQASLSIDIGADGKPLIWCGAGCDRSVIVERCGLTWPELLGDDTAAPYQSEKRHLAVYQYLDAAGELLHETVRSEPKDFRQRRPDGAGGYIWNLKDIEPVLYRLPFLVNADPEAWVYVCEGEKDADRVADLGLIATTAPMGAGKWRPSYSETLRARKVAILPDNDAPGHKHAQQVATALAGVAAAVRVVQLDGLPEKGDVSDWLDAGHTRTELEQLAETLPPAKPNAFGIRGIAELLAELATRPRPTWLIEGIWPAGAYGVVAAEDKAGKTWFILDLGVSKAAGLRFLERFQCPTPGAVLLFLGEGGEEEMARRLAAIAEAKGISLADLPLRLAFRTPHLTDREQMAELGRELAEHPADLVIIDPLYLAAYGAKGSDLYAMGEHLSNAQQVVSATGAALVIVHHFNKTGDGRGHQRMSGVGPSAWGRVLGTAEVLRRSTSVTSGETTVTLAWRFIGSQIPDTEATIRRRVWADDQQDLGSALHYVVEAAEPQEATPDSSGFGRATDRVLKALAAAERPLSWLAIGDLVAQDGTGFGLKKRTVMQALSDLAAAGLVEEAVPSHGPHPALWATVGGSAT